MKLLAFCSICCFAIACSEKQYKFPPLSALTEQEREFEKEKVYTDSWVSLQDSAIACVLPLSSSGYDFAKSWYSIYGVILIPTTVKLENMIHADSLLNQGIYTSNQNLLEEYNQLKAENRKVYFHNFHLYPQNYVYQVLGFRDSSGDTILCINMTCNPGDFKNYRYRFIDANDGWICYNRIWLNYSRKRFIMYDHNGDA